MAALLDAVNIGERSLDLCRQLEILQSNKSSMCQVTSRSENVYMMAVLMDQSSYEKHIHMETLLLILYTHVHTAQEHFSLGKTRGINE